MWAEGAGASGWGPWTWWQAIVSGISGIIVLAALGLPGIMVYLAEFELLLGSALGPLILPMFCCSATSSFGWGPVNFLIVNALRLVMIGAVELHDRAGDVDGDHAPAPTRRWAGPSSAR